MNCPKYKTLIGNAEMKKYPKYKPSCVDWIGEIPEHWSVKCLKWITKFKYGDSLAINDRKEGLIPVFGSNGITGFHNVTISGSPCIIIGRKGRVTPHSRQVKD